VKNVRSRDSLPGNSEDPQGRRTAAQKAPPVKIRPGKSYRKIVQKIKGRCKNGNFTGTAQVSGINLFG